MTDELVNTINTSSLTFTATLLSPAHQKGLVAVGTFAAFSIVTLALLLLFLARRASLHVIDHVGSAGSFKDYIWIFNLLLALLLQSLGFVIGLHWSVVGNISASSGWCDAQAGSLQAGELATGAFALAIAV